MPTNSSTIIGKYIPSSAALSTGATAVSLKRPGSILDDEIPEVPVTTKKMKAVSSQAFGNFDSW